MNVLYKIMLNVFKSCCMSILNEISDTYTNNILHYTKHIQSFNYEYPDVWLWESCGYN